MNEVSTELALEAKSLLHQLQSVIRKLNDSMYASPISMLSNSSIGAHVRHTLEFFECFQLGINSTEINYDLRKRNIELEVNRHAAMNMIEHLSETVHEIGQAGPILLIRQRPDGTSHTMETSRDREFWYTIEHAIHHLAIIKIGILHLDPNFSFPENFGVASSTVIFQQMQSQ